MKSQPSSHRTASRSTRLLAESLESRCLLSADVSPWHNAVEPTDVNRDGYVSGIDALLIINELNLGAGGLSRTADAGPVSTFYDVNNDFFVSGIDALLVINQLNADAAPDPVTQGIPPTAVPDEYSTPVNTTLSVDAPGVLENDTDPEGDIVSAEKIGSGPTNGQLTFNSDGSFIYVPNTDFTGTDTFRYQTLDAESGRSLSTTVTIVVGGANNAPVAVADAYETDEDTTLTVLALGVLENDTDTENNALTATLVDDVQNGTLVLNANGSFSYEPNLDFNGSDTFTYRANDGTSNSNIATVTITVNPVAELPRATPDMYSVDEDDVLEVAATGVLSNDTNPDNPQIALTAALVTSTTNGTLNLRPDGSFDYTPDPNFFGTDSFVYTASNGTQTSTDTIVTLTVNPVNDVPIAHLDAYLATAGTTLTVNADDGLLRNDTDVDGQGLQAVLITNTADGTLNLDANGSFTYTPDVGFTGVDSFTYAASDTEDQSDPVVVRISVQGDNSTVGFTFSAVDASGSAIQSVPIGGNFFVQVEVADIRADPSGVFQAYLDVFYDVGQLEVTGNPTFGAEYPNARKFDLSTAGIVNETGAAAGQSELGGGDKLLLRIPVRSLTSGIAVFTGDPRDVSPQNDVLLFGESAPESPADMVFVPGSITVIEGFAPTARDDAYTVAEDGQLDVEAPGVLGNDTQPDQLPLVAELVSPPQHGALTLNDDGSFIYIPTTNFNGTDTFTYVASDGTVTSNLATVTITVTPVNDAPIANDDSYTVNGASLTVNAANGVLANDEDVDKTGLTAVLVSGPTNGTLEFNPDGSFMYTPDPTLLGIDTFTYRAVAGELESNIATVTLTVQDLSPSTISGAVYTDVNNDGIRGLNEAPIAGLLITLQGVTATGTPVLRTTSTAHDGSYTFDNVTRGSYTVIEDQPLFMIDGKDTFGGVESPTNDAIFVALPAGVNVTGVNFGEWGLLPDFASNADLLARVNTGELTVAIDAAGGQRWYCSTLGWEQFRSVNVQMNSARTFLTITATTTGGQTLTSTVPMLNNPLVQVQGQRPEGLILRLAGPASSFGLSSAAIAAAADRAFA